MNNDFDSNVATCNTCGFKTNIGNGDLHKHCGMCNCILKFGKKHIVLNTHKMTLVTGTKIKNNCLMWICEKCYNSI